MHNAITDVEGIKVGHYTDLEGITGCTVVLCEGGGVGGVDVRGSGPATRETDLMRPMNLVQEAHAVLLTGGSAYGLDAAGGVMRWLEEQGIGFNVGVGVVPIVPTAALFDLTIGDSKARPDAEAGYQACQAASDGPVAEGNVGAGTGATVGKLLGPKLATKSGLGTASVKIGKGIVVGAIVAVNAFGDVVDPESGTIIAGTRKPVVGGFVNTVKRMQGDLGQTLLGFANTTLAVVATNACLTKEGANKMAQMAHDGLARSIRPVHTMFDGDTVFALATGKPPKKGKEKVKRADPSVVGTAAAEVLAQAVVRAARQAESLGGVKAACDL
ncbi:MAG: P1 family peptidase [Chloroflexota bacterium]|nr:P1 family peptidase [Chloroflexota bacterium]